MSGGGILSPKERFKMKSVFRFAFAGALVLALGQAFAGPFTAGNIVVLRVGDGSAALTTAATPIYLEEYTPGGTLVQTIAAPTSTVGSNRQITATGTSGSSPNRTKSCRPSVQPRHSQKRSKAG